MHRRWMLMVSLATLVGAQAAGSEDWKSELAKKTVGQAAQEGIEHAVKDAAFDAALGQPVLNVGRAVSRAEIGSVASAGIESAMTAANVASSMDSALGAAEAAKKANKARKAIKKPR
jgi:hypothetical protein